MKKGVAAVAALLAVVLSLSLAMPAFSKKDAKNNIVSENIRLCHAAPISLRHSEGTDFIFACEEQAFAGNIKKGRNPAYLISTEGISFVENRCFYKIVELNFCSKNFPKENINRRAP